MAKTKAAAADKPFGHNRRIRVAARYAAMVAPFISTEEVRYYLHGIRVEPHHEKGVLLVATDGHCLGVAYDPDGETDGSWICGMPDQLLYKLRRNGDIEAQLHFAGSAAYLTDGEFDGAATEVSENHVLALGAPAIDGDYPDWRRVIPKGLAQTVAPWFNAHNMGKFRHTSIRDRQMVSVHAESMEGPAVILNQGEPNFLGVMMPMMPGGSKPKNPEWPSWLSTAE